MSKKYDIAILGGGPGGYVAAIRASQLGFKTAIIDKDKLGGICLNWGCIPTKALLKNAEVYDTISKRANDFGISVEGVSFDLKKVVERSRGVAEQMSKGVDYLMKKNKIDVFSGFGKFKDAHTLEVVDEKGKNIETVQANSIIIATGASPKKIPSIPVDRKHIITSREALVPDEIPEKLIIIGAGAIGVEFAYFYNVYGSEVTIVEMLDNIVPVEDEEVSKALARAFKKRKIKIHTKSKVEKAEVKDGKVFVTIEKKGEKIELVADKVLNAIGVTGNIEGYGLETIGVEIDRGHIKVNKKTYATNVEGVYAIGDVIGPPWLAHVASAEGIHCVETIKGLNPPPVDYSSIPGCTYAHPQIGSIGMTEKAAKEAGYELKIGKFPFTASGKSAAIGERDGFVNLLFDAKYGELLGAHIIGAEATELIAELGLGKSLEATYETIIKTIHAHPTLSESIMEAAADANNEAIHI